MDNQPEKQSLFSISGDRLPDNNTQYSKRYIHNDPSLQIVEITWKGRSCTSIHNHNSDNITQGFALILEGTFRNTEFTKTSSGRVLEKESKIYKKGEFITFSPGIIHQMENLSSFVGVTLHIYSPSIKTMETFILNLSTAA